MNEIESKRIDVEGLVFQTYPLPPLLALRLDKKLITLILPTLKSIKGLSLDSEIELGSILENIGNALKSLSDEDFEDFLIKMFSRTQFISTKEGALDVNKAVIDSIFTGKLLSIYKLLWEIMKFNRFSPFVVVGGGIVNLKTYLSKQDTKKTILNGKESETLEN